MKGQASIEYLSTFMWTALAILAVVGVLAYFGVFNLVQYQEQSCNTGEQIPCLDVIAYPEGQVSVLVRNDLSADVEFTSGELTINEQTVILNEIDEFVETGVTVNTIFDTGQEFAVGDTEDYDVCFKYRTEYNGREYLVCGDARTEVQPQPPAEELIECRDGSYDPPEEECDVVGGAEIGCSGPYYCGTDCTCHNRPPRDRFYAES